MKQGVLQEVKEPKKTKKKAKKRVESGKKAKKKTKKREEPIISEEPKEFSEEKIKQE